MIQVLGLTTHMSPLALPALFGSPVFAQAHHHQDLHHPHSLSCGVITLGGGKPGTRNIFFFLLYKSIALRLNGQEEQIQQGIRQEVIGI